MSSPMRVFFAASLFLCACAVNGRAQVFPQPQGQMETKYDRFTDVRTEMLYRLQVAHREPQYDFQNLYLSVRADFASATSSKPPDYVGIIFTSWSLWDNQYVGQTKLYAIIDGERISYETFIPLQREVINGKHVVLVGGRMTYKQFQQIANGKTVEMRLGDFKFTLTEPMMKTVREYAARAQSFIREM
jgi:hypothetical protein